MLLLHGFTSTVASVLLCLALLLLLQFLLLFAFLLLRAVMLSSLLASLLLLASEFSCTIKANLGRRHGMEEKFNMKIALMIFGENRMRLLLSMCLMILSARSASS